MNAKRIFRLLIVGLFTAGLAAAFACGDDGGETENDPNDNDDDPDEVTEAPTCEDDDPPARCDASYEDFDAFYPATHVNELAIADETCCVDFTDDGEGDPDNGLADLLNLASGAADIDREELNEEIAESIEEGDINIVFEHEGLEEFEAGEEFTINFLLGEEVDSGEATIDPASFEDGVHPHALIPGGEIHDDDSISAGPGTMVLSLDIGALTDGEVDLDLDLTISEAQLTADAATTNGVDGGVDLENGRLGGLILVEEIIDALNDFAADCECLDNVDPLLEMEQVDEIECVDEIEDQDGDELEDTCEANDEELCGTLGANCHLVSIVSAAPDIDYSEDGIFDAISVGLELGGEATVITEVATD